MKCAVGIDPKQATVVPKETPATLEPLKANNNLVKPERESASEEKSLNEAAVGGSAVVTGLIVVVILAIAGGGYVFRDQINDLLDYFTAYIEGNTAHRPKRSETNSAHLKLCDDSFVSFDVWCGKGQHMIVLPHNAHSCIFLPLTTSLPAEAGPSGYVTFLLGYSVLEVLAIPATPLTMSAGLLFGPAIGTVLCSLAGVVSTWRSPSNAICQGA